jgi:ribosomal protein S18 acetylase RimI-like enzyme
MVAEAGELRLLLDTVSLLWQPWQRWTPGEIAWALLTTQDEPPVRLFPDGWAWRQPDRVVLAATSAATTAEILDWANGTAVEAPDGDPILLAALRERGYHEIPGEPFSLSMRRAVDDAPSHAGDQAGVVPELAGGYLVRPATSGDDLLAAHRTAWRPADLPFAPDLAPTFDPAAVSPLTAAMLAAVQTAPLYRDDLHLVAEAPGGGLAGSCITWLDPATAVAAIEPLGVHPDHRRRGLAGALCRCAVRLVRAAGGREVVIHPRGDRAYPAPRGAYLRAGFKPTGRTRLYTV